MGEIIIKIKGYKCERCGHEWIPRTKEKPRVCLKCKSSHGDRKKK